MTKRAIITGASSGIGREIALALAEVRVEVVLAARRRSLLSEVARDCEALGAVALVVECDIMVLEDRKRLVLEAQQLGSGVEPVLVNSTGVAEFGDYATMAPASIEVQLGSNMTGPMLMCHEVLPWMLHFGSGHIVNVLSMAANTPISGAAVYCASKAGLLMFGRSISTEYRRKGVRVSSILPGATDTPLWDNKDWAPTKADMLTSRMVAEAIRDVILAPPDRNIDELTLMPPKGVL